MEQDFLHYLEQLERHVMAARRVPFTDKVMLEEELVYELVDRLRDSLPEALDRSDRILRDRDQIIRQAQERAEDIVNGAEEYVQELASETNVVREAEKQAEELVDRARDVAREIQVGAREYADELLQEVQGTLEASLQQVRTGRAQLQVPAAGEVAVARDHPSDNPGESQ